MAQANREEVRESSWRTWKKTRNEHLAYLHHRRAENKERIREYSRAYAERKR